MNLFSNLQGRLLALPLLLIFLHLSLPAQNWTSIGPEGGDARSLAFDPADLSEARTEESDPHPGGTHRTRVPPAQGAIAAVSTGRVSSPVR